MSRCGSLLACAAVALSLARCGGETEIEPRCGETANQREALSTRCFARTLDVDTNSDSASYGQVPCSLFAAFPAGSEACSCTGTGYAPTSRPPEAVLNELSGSG